MVLIKRYPNRKLYDTQAKQYITLEGLAALVRANQEVQVVDHETGDDLTDVTLTQVIFALARRRTALFPRSLLSHLIRLGDFPRDSWHTRLEDTVAGLLAEGELSDAGAERLRELTASATIPQAHLSRSAEKRMEAALRVLDLPSMADTQRLQAQLDDLEEQLEQLVLQPRQRTAPD